MPDGSGQEVRACRPPLSHCPRRRGRLRGLDDEAGRAARRAGREGEADDLRVEGSQGPGRTADLRRGRRRRGRRRWSDSRRGVAGVHMVAFRVMSTDNHPVEASFTFDLAPPAPSPTSETHTRGIVGPMRPRNRPRATPPRSPARHRLRPKPSPGTGARRQPPPRCPSPRSSAGSPSSPGASTPASGAAAPPPTRMTRQGRRGGRGPRIVRRVDADLGVVSEHHPTECVRTVCVRSRTVSLSTRKRSLRH